jgi:predicted sulfurtransferase
MRVLSTLLTNNLVATEGINRTVGTGNKKLEVIRWAHNSENIGNLAAKYVKRHYYAINSQNTQSKIRPNVN